MTIRVGLVCTWGVRCGHAEFASNIVERVPEVDFKPITDMSDFGIVSNSSDVDLIHIIWDGYGFSPMTEHAVRTVQALGKKVVLSNQTTRPDVNNHPLMDACDRVISTEPLPHDPRFTYIPMGIPDGWVANSEPENLVGTVGFPFSWKGIPHIVQAVKQAGMGFMGVLPDYPPTAAQCEGERQQIRQVLPEAILHTAWLSKGEVREQLSRCKVLLFAHRPYPGIPYGVSSACRYGLAVGRPTVFNRFEMYRDLFPYEDELYFVEDDSVDNLAATITTAATNVKRPDRLLKDMSWNKCATQFLEIYKSLL